MGTLKTLWNSSKLTIKTKINVLVTRVFLSAIKVTDYRKFLAFEMRCYGKDRVSSRLLQKKQNGHCTIVTLIKQRKLKLLAHTPRERTMINEDSDAGNGSRNSAPQKTIKNTV